MAKKLPPVLLLFVFSLFSAAVLAQEAFNILPDTSDQWVQTTFPLRPDGGEFKLPELVQTVEGIDRKSPTWKPGDEVTVRIKFKPEGNDRSLDVSAGNTRLRWAFAGIDQFDVQYWSDVQSGRPVTFRINQRGTLNDSFSLNPLVRSWSRFYHFSQSDMYARPMTMRLVRSESNWSVFVYGIFAGTLDASSPLTFKHRNVEILDVRRSAFPNPERFLPLDISARWNAATRLGQKPIPANRMVTIGAVPFFLGESKPKGFNHLNLGLSWGRFQLNDDGDNRPFGGRWGGVQANCPTRFCFRVEQDQYSALYVLAASEKPIPDAPQTFTVQFYRPKSGFPVEFVSPEVPLISEQASGEKIVLDGRSLYLIRVPLDAGKLQEFSDLPYLEFELTKPTSDYQPYPDPGYYSRHGAGLPTAVRVFALTMERQPIHVDFEPTRYANVFCQPEPIAYEITVTNRSGNPKSLTLNLNSCSHDTLEKTKQSRAIQLKSGESQTVRIPLALKRFGHHEIDLTIAEQGTALYSQHRTLAYLRERSYAKRSFDEPGFQFGFWNWNGGHGTIAGEQLMEIMAKSGMTAVNSSNGLNLETSPEACEGAKKWNVFGYHDRGFQATENYQEWKQKESKRQADLDERRRKEGKPVPAPVSSQIDVRMTNIGTEPYDGIFSHGALPQYYGEPELDPLLDAAEQVRAGVALTTGNSERIRTGIAELKRTLPQLKADRPNLKIMMPWGDPNYAVTYLRDPEIAKYIDGILYDTGMFDRMPEMQLHQCVPHRLWQFTQGWKRYCPDRDPLLVSIEGPCYMAVLPGGATEQELSDYTTRCIFILGSYGMSKQFSVFGPSACTSWWGEQHYGGGAIGRLATLNPYLAYSAVAATTRHLSPMRFVRWIETGSRSVYTLQFADVNNPKRLLHVLWTIRGTRTVQIPGLGEVYDSMDNLISPDGAGRLTVSSSPIFVYGLESEPTVRLDAPGAVLNEALLAVSGPVKPLVDPGKDGWKQVVPVGPNAAEEAPNHEEDRDYTESNPLFIRRFPADMALETVDVPALDANGSQTTVKATAISLPEQAVNRGTMPHYTTLVPPKPVKIPGTPRRLSIWVKGCSDWGRIVYELRDAKGEKWISIGQKEAWNGDDTRSLSAFNFDGWQLLEFPLPGNLPWDCARTAGSCAWGASGGDKIVDYPLQLEKIRVERREQIIYVNSLEKTAREPVLLGTLYAGYDSEDQMSAAAERISRIRMPEMRQTFQEPNPIVDLAASGELAPTTINKVEEPITYNDGTTGIFHFNPVSDAVAYDFYLSTREDGTGALCLAQNVKESPVQIRGFMANTDFYAFVVYRTKDRKTSKPSPAFKLNLKDNFGNK